MLIHQKTNYLLIFVQNIALSLFTFFIIFSAYLYSYLTTLEYVNFPLLSDYDFVSISTPFAASALAFILPPLFIIGFYRSHFKSRLKLMFQVQSFFYTISVAVFFLFFWIIVNYTGILTNLTLFYYFSALSRVMVCLYLYFSIDLSLELQAIPPPIYSSDLEDKGKIAGAEYTFFGQNLMPLPNSKKISNSSQHTITPSSSAISEKNVRENINRFEEMNNKNLIKKAWKRHSLQIPIGVRSSIYAAQTLGFIMVILANFPMFGLPYPIFLTSYSFLAVFFLYFFLLYLMQKKPLALWRFPYVLVVFFFMFNNIFFEHHIWRVLLLLFFACQCYIIFNFYYRGKNWFLK